MSDKMSELSSLFVIDEPVIIDIATDYDWTQSVLKAYHPGRRPAVIQERFHRVITVRIPERCVMNAPPVVYSLHGNGIRILLEFQFVRRRQLQRPVFGVRQFEVEFGEIGIAVLRQNIHPSVGERGAFVLSNTCVCGETQTVPGLHVPEAPGKKAGKRIGIWKDLLIHRKRHAIRLFAPCSVIYPLLPCGAGCHIFCITAGRHFGIIVGSAEVIRNVFKLCVRCL